MNESESISDNENGSIEVIEEESQQSPVEDRIVSKNETRRVTQLKLLVMFILVVSAITVGCGVFFYIRGSETIKFQDYFTSDAIKILEAIGWGVENSISILDMMSTTLVGHARATNQSWPFVILPYYANRAAKTLNIGTGIALFFSVLVQPDQRRAWEDFVWDNREILVNQSNRVMATDPNYHGGINWNLPLSKELYYDDIIPYNESRVFSPAWQQYPMPSKELSGVNWDWYADPPALNYLKVETNEKRTAVISIPYILPDPNDPDEMAAALYWADAYQGIISPADNPFEPVSDITYPILDVLDGIDASTTNQNQSPLPKVVGNMATAIYWRDLIRNILPQDRKGLVLVINNTCDVSFTYQINGPTVEFKGRGDHHDTRFDSLGLHRDIDNLKNNSFITSKYTGVPINSEYCPFTFNVYPSQEMKDIYVTNNAIIFTIIAIFIFIFTSIVFVVYDSRVERRQQLVMTSAIRSNAVVSSLFPSNVREVVLQNSTNPKSKGGIDSSDVNRKSKRLSNTSADTSASAPPIADLYPDTTVLFADIKGFTAWSSVRDPHQVFTLLETLYGEFDKLARERKVFKVETIGDSYVAVTGLPEPMKNHAVVMAKFADAMLRKAHDVVHDLVLSLGPGTDELCLRVGLNSGPTTAGVLRGEKSRFQLFGDTVNTASRMESTGLATKIQCSQRTADLLIAGGKEHWLVKRADPVEAKGKGTMETYWVSPSGRKSSDVSEKTNVFIEWNINLFLCLLNDLIISRNDEMDDIESPVEHRNNAMVLGRSNRTKFGVSAVVEEQVKSFIATVASMYNDNPYHNFEHASHIAMGIKSLLDNVKEQSVIVIDPFDRFCILLITLVHDINNATERYPESSPGSDNTELNVADMIWNLLMTPKFQEFRKCFCSNDANRNRFVEVASSILSSDTGANKSSMTSDITDSQMQSDFIVHLFQVAKRIHTMQHWHVYQKWNKYLFCQACSRYNNGQREDNPYENWFLQEFYNFDHIIIPLIVKLKEFNVLGNCCETLLRFAEDNRLEWKAKGQESIAEWTKEVNQGICSSTFSVANLNISL